MKNKKIYCMLIIVLLLITALSIAGCGANKNITQISQLSDKTFAVPTGTIADQLVLTKFPNAKFVYFDSALDACLAVKSGKADAVAYDEPILKNIAAKNAGLKVLPEMITKDDYGFAVQLGNNNLKATMDKVINELKTNGTYDEMMNRWLPKAGSPAAMPEIQLTGANGVLKFGTASVTEPFSFKDSNQNIVGFDIELATYIAKELGMKLQVVDMSFNDLIPSLTSGKVDMIGSLMTISQDRSKSALFSEPYYSGGIAALVRNNTAK